MKPIALSWCKATLFTGLCGIFLMTNVGCDDDDVIAGAVIGGIIGGALSDDDDDRRHRRHRRERHHRRYRDRSHYVEAYNIEALDSGVTMVWTDETIGNIHVFAQRFDVSEESAEQFVNAMEQAQGGEIQAIKDLGLRNKDLKSLKKLQLPNARGISSLAKHMSIDKEKAKNILQAFIDESQLQFNDVYSPVWSQCLANGEWKTPQNLSCKQVDKVGCSPENGATMCLPVL